MNRDNLQVLAIWAVVIFFIIICTFFVSCHVPLA